MTIKLIKNETDYNIALARVDEIFDAAPSTAEGDELDLLTSLIELYESKNFPMDMPDPITAIRFRMNQLGFRAKDLIPYIGSGSKVSEVLSGKRPLSLSMIRKLNTELGIPAEILLREPNAVLPTDASFKQASLFPFNEMYKLGWFDSFAGTLNEAKVQKEEILTKFCNKWSMQESIFGFNRQRISQKENNDQAALIAWRIRVMNLAAQERLPVWKQGILSTDFFKQLVHLSYLETGPVLAKEYLNKNGIALIFVNHLVKTRLDGAALMLPGLSPVIALTLRYDRLDYFWFTLFHELAHIALHFEKDTSKVFLDELSEKAQDSIEEEADNYASEMLIPITEWKNANLTCKSNPSSILAFASRLRISPAIPAGRLRYETGNYKIFTNLVGSGSIRRLFSE